MIKALILIGLATAFIVIRNHVEGRILRKYEQSDEYALSTLAITKKCSVYDIFHLAGEEWQFSSKKREDDFADYLRTGHIPPYVVRYVRGHLTDSDRRHRALIHRGSGLPWSWSA